MLFYRYSPIVENVNSRGVDAGVIGIDPTYTKLDGVCDVWFRLDFRDTTIVLPRNSVCADVVVS